MIEQRTYVKSGCPPFGWLHGSGFVTLSVMTMSCVGFGWKLARVIEEMEGCISKIGSEAT